ncbi:hypothetical protein BJX76DRAFT_368145 [Aspergillus varians]
MVEVAISAYYPRIHLLTTRHSRDPFGRLAVELRENIATRLVTPDFLNLRLASRAMEPLFHGDYFWKSRFGVDGDRGYLGDVAVDGPVDWRRLYCTSSRTEAQWGMKIKVWETIRWVKDAMSAEANFTAPPLEFCGRALQYYHNDSCARGRRVERADIPSKLTKIAVTMVSGPMIFDQYPHSGQFESATEITALEFMTEDGNCVTLGYTDPRAKTITEKGLIKQMRRYEAQEPIRNRIPQCPFDNRGVRILFDAQAFKGFRISYNTEGIYSIGILHMEAALYPIYRRSIDWSGGESKHPVFGYDADDCCTYDMEMDQILQVAGTFEGNVLVELGIRGHRSTN